MLWSFILASASVTLMPGASLAVVLDRTLRGPLRAGLAALAGVVAADALLLAVTMSGLGALLTASPAALTMLKGIGALYLGYLAWASWRAGPASANVEDAAVTTAPSTGSLSRGQRVSQDEVGLNSGMPLENRALSVRHSTGTAARGPMLGAFAQGMGVTLLNPSIIVFLLAFFPPFLRRDAGVASQLALLGPLFLATVAAVLLGYVLLAHRLGGRVKHGAGSRWLSRLTALALLGGGLYTALSG
ncbi:LysE family translocator [Neisseriaceae bacterium JH1-16]|nr:LysE family translocator [Neisseriaceae bacterium JH1-16]